MFFILFICIIVFCGTVWLLTEPYCIKIKNIELTYSSLPSAFDGFSVLFLADIHTAKWGFFEKCLCNKLKETRESDICVLGGDLAYTESVTENIPKILENAKIRGGVYAVFGNTEYKSHNRSQKLAEIYRSFGYTVLRNENCEIRKGDDFISLIGLDDPINMLDDTEEAFAGIREGGFRILLSHCPSMAADGLDYGVNLTLAGHTHGGQVKLPFCTVYTHMNKNKFLNTGIWSAGRIGKKLKRKVEDFNLIITNGLGTSKLWIRFCAPPQIYRITLRKKQR